MSARDRPTDPLAATPRWRVRGVRAAGVIGLGLALGGCATRADLLQQERKLTEMMQQQSRSMDDMRRELERLREDMTVGRGSRAPVRVPAAKLPTRAKPKVAQTPPEQPTPTPTELGMTPSPDGQSVEAPGATTGTIAAVSAPPPGAPGAGAAGSTPPSVPAEPPAQAAGSSSPPSAAPSAVDEDWKREVAQERAVASASGAPERAQYLGALEGVEKGDCSKMKAVSAGSPLSDNAIYWQGKCLAARGDQRKAESRLNEVVTRYPKSDKAPAALWARGQLQLRAGNSSAARATLSRLIRDYPASAEAAKARKKLAEI